MEKIAQTVKWMDFFIQTLTKNSFSNTSKQPLAGASWANPTRPIFTLLNPRTSPKILTPDIISFDQHKLRFVYVKFK